MDFPAGVLSRNTFPEENSFHLIETRLIYIACVSSVKGFVSTSQTQHAPAILPPFRLDSLHQVFDDQRDGPGRDVRRAFYMNFSVFRLFTHMGCAFFTREGGKDSP